MNYDSVKTLLYMLVCVLHGVYTLAFMVVVILLNIHFGEPANFISGLYTNGASYALQNADLSNVLLLFDVFFGFSLLSYAVLLFPLVEFLFFYCLLRRR